MASLLRGWMSKDQAQQVIFPDDDVIPGFVLDDTPKNRGLLLTWTLRFEDVLDADMIHDALVRLLRIGDWRKIGGRLKVNSEGKLEIHVPKAFTPERPAVRYTHVTHDMPIKEHPLASTLPGPTDCPSVQEGDDEDDFVSLAIPEGGPTRFKDLLVGDTPQLGLHIVSFTDTTLVSLCWAHTMTDGLGRHALAKAWSALLAGRDSEVPPFRGFRDDPVEQILSRPRAEDDEPYALKPKLLGGWRMVVFVLRFIGDILFTPKQVSRAVFLPRRTIEALRERAMQDLTPPSSDDQPHQAKVGVDDSGAGAGPAKRAPFLSEGDVLTAWLTRAACSPLSPTSTRPVSVLNPFEMRSRLPSVFDPAAAYVQNLVMPSYALLSVREVLTSPLGALALRIRTALAAQAAEKQVVAELREMVHAHRTSGSGLLVGEAGALPVIFSNWTKARFFDVVDFGPAVVKAFGTGVNASGKPVVHHATILGSDPVFRNCYFIGGKDPSGSYWIFGVLAPKAWAAMEKELAALDAKVLV